MVGAMRSYEEVWLKKTVLLSKAQMIKYSM